MVSSSNPNLRETSTIIKPGNDEFVTRFLPHQENGNAIELTDGINESPHRQPAESRPIKIACAHALALEATEYSLRLVCVPASTYSASQSWRSKTAHTHTTGASSRGYTLKIVSKSKACNPMQPQPIPRSITG